MTIKHKLPRGFVYLSDICPQIKQNLKYATEDNFTGKVITGYKDNKVILTIDAANKLKDAYQEIDKLGYNFMIWDAYRPMVAIDIFQTWSRKPDDARIKSNYYPNLKKEELFDKGFISPNTSSHSRGSTVDLTLINKESNEELDMGTIFDFFHEKSNTLSPDISDIAKKNRKLLQQIMTKHNFVNLPIEWWHFTLKDEPFPNQYFNFCVQ